MSYRCRSFQTDRPSKKHPNGCFTEVFDETKITYEEERSGGVPDGIQIFEVLHDELNELVRLVEEKRAQANCHLPTTWMTRALTSDEFFRGVAPV